MPLELLSRSGAAPEKLAVVALPPLAPDCVGAALEPGVGAVARVDAGAVAAPVGVDGVEFAPLEDVVALAVKPAPVAAAGANCATLLPLAATWKAPGGDGALAGGAAAAAGCVGADAGTGVACDVALATAVEESEHVDASCACLLGHTRT